MAIQHNTTTCLDPASVQLPDLSSLNSQALASTLADHLKAIANQASQRACEVESESIERDNLLAGAITQIDITVQALKDRETVEGLSDVQIQALTEAIQYFADENGEINTLGSVLTQINTINLALNAKCDKSVVDQLRAEFEAYKEADITIDTSGLATLEDLCAISTKITTLVAGLSAGLSAVGNTIMELGAHLNSAMAGFTPIACAPGTFTAPVLTSTEEEAPNGGGAPI